MGQTGIRFGMHKSLWTAAWTREAAERVVRNSAEHGLDGVEIALLSPDAVDAAPSAAAVLDPGMTCRERLNVERRLLAT